MKEFYIQFRGKLLDAILAAKAASKNTETVWYVYLDPNRTGGHFAYSSERPLYPLLEVHLNKESWEREQVFDEPLLPPDIGNNAIDSFFDDWLEGDAVDVGSLDLTFVELDGSKVYFYDIDGDERTFFVSGLMANKDIIKNRDLEQRRRRNELPNFVHIKVEPPPQLQPLVSFKCISETSLQEMEQVAIEAEKLRQDETKAAEYVRNNCKAIDADAGNMFEAAMLKHGRACFGNRFSNSRVVELIRDAWEQDEEFLKFIETFFGDKNTLNLGEK